MEDFGFVSKLFLLRHGETERKRKLPVLSDIGRTKLKAAAEDIRRLSENDHFCFFASSRERKAIETAFCIGDYLGEHNSELILTNKLLEHSAPWEVYKGLMEVIKESNRKHIVMVGHLEGINFLPKIIRKEHCNIKDTPEDFGKDYGCGAYVDLITGNYERIGSNQ